MLCGAGSSFIRGGPFNQAWRQFFGAHPNATTAQILRFTGDLRSGVPQTTDSIGQRKLYNFNFYSEREPNIFTV